MPEGAVAARTGSIAGWPADGWRFVAPREGLRVFDRGAQAFRLYAGGWRLASAPGAPGGGATVDAEARAALVSILERLVAAGVFAAS
jgi:hypothetical protein